MGLTSISETDNPTVENLSDQSAFNTFKNPELQKDYLFKDSSIELFVGMDEEEQGDEILDSGSSGTEKILKEITGIIVETGDSFVAVKLETDIVVNFPKILFDGKDFLKFGQAIVYKIKEDFKGYKYQDFEACVDSRENPYREKINKILNTI